MTGDSSSFHNIFRTAKSVETDPALLYVQLITTVDSLPVTLSDCTPKLVTLHENLLRDENPHIYQTGGEKDGIMFEISIQPRSEMKNIDEPRFLSIWIRGSKLDEVIAFYREIREGKAGAAWDPVNKPKDCSTDQEKKEAHSNSKEPLIEALFYFLSGNKLLFSTDNPLSKHHIIQ